MIQMNEKCSERLIIMWQDQKNRGQSTISLKAFRAMVLQAMIIKESLIGFLELSPVNAGQKYFNSTICSDSVPEDSYGSCGFQNPSNKKAFIWIFAFIWQYSFMPNLKLQFTVNL